eukprot:243144_1
MKRPTLVKVPIKQNFSCSKLVKKNILIAFVVAFLLWQCLYLLFFNNDIVDMSTTKEMDILKHKIQQLELQNYALQNQISNYKVDTLNTETQSKWEKYKNKQWYSYVPQEGTIIDTSSNRGSERGVGGAWSLCTHIYRYGPNFDRGFASFLATTFQPKTALEFGCGIGLYINYISKFSPHSNDIDSLYLGIEPQSMLHAGIFNYDNSYSAIQLAMNIFEVNKTILHSLGQFDLVYSSEVAEHIPNQLLFYDGVDFLINHTAKYLVFGAARKDQGGTGHLRSSMWNRNDWEDCFGRRGMTHLPKLSAALRNACYNDWDKARNTFVMIKNDYLKSLNMNVEEIDDMFSGLSNVNDLWPLFQNRVEQLIENKECEDVNSNFTDSFKERMAKGNISLIEEYQHISKHMNNTLHLQNPHKIKT